MNAQQHKTELRKIFKQQREELNPQEIFNNTKQICSHLSAWLKKQSCSQLFMYFSFRQEPDLSFLLDHLEASITLGFPVLYDKGKMQFHKWQKGEPLQLNRYGIKEPVPSAHSSLSANAQTMILVPCLAVDPWGYRLGYGGGYYDRFLAQAQESPSIGILWQAGFVNHSLPIEPFDIPLSWICTELGIWAVRK